MTLFARIREALLGPVEDLYVDPLWVELNDMEDQMAIAAVEDRQRTAFRKLRAEGKSLLFGYIPPEPFVADRIDAQAVKAGHVMPTEQKRHKKVTPVKVSLPIRSKSANS